MIVKYCFDGVPMFFFNAQDVPVDCYLGYVKGDDIYKYLEANLRPTDIVAVTKSSCEEGCHTIIVYNMSDDVLQGMPDFVSIFDDLDDQY